ncbi:hypothetical protein P7K49_013474 [Saguinus oedipus]|uniref:Uncharacterized protein n=1 Tax=Saguinus oedipus TaxID=9490 RepID=A0ABQ9VHD3_SAGOE|nr:hypothetical protein P7K49_013474 [Saguinus oedipus]
MGRRAGGPRRRSSSRRCDGVIIGFGRSGRREWAPFEHRVRRSLGRRGPTPRPRQAGGRAELGGYPGPEAGLTVHGYEVLSGWRASAPVLSAALVPLSTLGTVSALGGSAEVSDGRAFS